MTEIELSTMQRLSAAPLEGGERLQLVQTVENGTFTAESGVSFTELPPFVRAVVYSEKAGSFIRHEVWLPEKWNGIFVGTGNGGMAGQINYGALALHVREGYAVANTDMGTSRGREDGILNEDVHKDFGWRATHAMTVLAKKMLLAYYGKKEEYSYFVGASTGGQQAYAEAQRFPKDYDGIVAGVPANNRLFLHTYFLWNWRHLRKDGKGLFTKEEIEQVYRAATAFMQAHGDGEAGDGFVSFPWLDENTISDFMAYLEAACPQLSAEQRSALKAVYEGPKNPRTHEQIYCGMPIGSEVYGCGIWDCQAEESPHFYPFIWAFGKDYDGAQFDFDSDLEKASALLSENLNANNPDLSAFAAKGGKMIAFSGGSDPCVPYPDAMQYYNRVADVMGGYENTAAFFRFFVYAGREHGTGGRGVNVTWSNEKDKGSLLDALRLWREKGIAPDVTIGARVEQIDGEAKLMFARPTYPYKADKVQGRDFPQNCDIRYLKQ